MLDFQNFHDPLEGQRANPQVVFFQTMWTAKLEADKPEGLWLSLGMIWMICYVAFRFLKIIGLKYLFFCLFKNESFESCNYKMKCNYKTGRATQPVEFQG